MCERIGFSDYQISKMIKNRNLCSYLRDSFSIGTIVKQLGYCSGRIPVFYKLYLTYNGDYNDIEFDDQTRIVLGSGVYRIGSMLNLTGVQTVLESLENKDIRQL